MRSFFYELLVLDKPELVGIVSGEFHVMGREENYLAFGMREKL